MAISHILIIFTAVLNGKKIAVVLPAYNAAQTIGKTYREIPMDLVDTVILVDDAVREREVYRQAVDERFCRTFTIADDLATTRLGALLRSRHLVAQEPCTCFIARLQNLDRRDCNAFGASTLRALSR